MAMVDPTVDTVAMLRWLGIKRCTTLRLSMHVSISSKRNKSNKHPTPPKTLSNSPRGPFGLPRAQASGVHLPFVPPCADIKKQNQRKSGQGTENQENGERGRKRKKTRTGEGKSKKTATTLLLVIPSHFDGPDHAYETKRTNLNRTSPSETKRNRASLP